MLDHHSGAAHAEIHDAATAATVVGVLLLVVAWFAARGMTVERVLSDNGGDYRSHAWRDTCAELGIQHKRPQTWCVSAPRPRRYRTDLVLLGRPGRVPVIAGGMEP